MGQGHIRTRTHDFYRHGTVTLFAALDYLSGKVFAHTAPRHRHQEWLALLHKIDQEIAPEFEFHIICDNYATHKHAKVTPWLKRHPRFHIHFIPTSSSGSIWWNASLAKLLPRSSARAAFAAHRIMCLRYHREEHYLLNTMIESLQATVPDILVRLLAGGHSLCACLYDRSELRFSVNRTARICQPSGWTQVEEIVDTVSGVRSARKGLDRLMALVRRGKVDIVAVYKLDRLGRSLSHLAGMIDEFSSHGISLISVSQGIDTSANNAMAKMQLGMLSVFAEFERDD